MSYEKFSADNAAMLLIDHQVGTMGWVKSISFEEMKRNTLMQLGASGPEGACPGTSFELRRGNNLRHRQDADAALARRCRPARPTGEDPARPV